MLGAGDIIQQYRAFVSVAEQKSLTRAAEILGYTQSGVSHLINNLEKNLGFQVLIRTKRGAELTPEGEQLLSYVKHMLAAEEDLGHMTELLRGTMTGNLRIGTFTSVTVNWLPAIIKKFSARYPGITIETINDTYFKIEQNLLENKIDCGFVTLPTRTEFDAHFLKRDHLLAVFHEEHPLAQESRITPQMLREEQLIVPAEGTNYDIGKLFSSAGLQPNILFNVSDDYAAIAMAGQGLGYTIMPELILQKLPLSGIRTVPFAGAERLIGIAVNRSRHVSPVTKAFLEIVRGMDVFCEP